jgi:conjugal transfer/entry exclusion protein
VENIKRKLEIINNQIQYIINDINIINNERYVSKYEYEELENTICSNLKKTIMTIKNKEIKSQLEKIYRNIDSILIRENMRLLVMIRDILKEINSFPVIY